ncbi:unnamed protein product [Prunus armeniaca]
MNVVGKGNVKLLLNGVNHVVHEVYYVPKLKNNLLSIGQLQERAQTPVPTNAQPERCLHTSLQDLSSIWHRRYGRLSYKAKCEALNCFKVFKKMVEKEKGLFVKCLRTDGGGEFTLNDFNDFYKQSGIKRQLTIAYTPQQNGVAERKNQTVMNMVTDIGSEDRHTTRGVEWSKALRRKAVGFGVNFEVQILLDLEWGENEENNEGEERVSENEDEDGNGDRGERSDSEGNEEAWGREVGNPYGPDENEGKVNEGRVRHPPPYLYYYVSGESLGEDEVHMAQVVATEDHFHLEEAVKNVKWRQAMDSEINSIEKNKTWTLTELPARAKKIGVKWVYKTKYNEHGEINKHKARLEAKGYSQKHDIDYTEVFAPVARMDTGLEKKGKKHLVYKLHKSLYGLKQAPRAWFSRIEAYFINEGFQRCDIEQTLFTKRNREGQIIIVSIYVDDLIFTGDDEDMMSEFKSYMLREFDMSDLGSMRFFLGIEVLQRAYGIFICQKRYALEILKRFGMLESNEVNSPIILGFMISKDEDEITVDETYFKQLVGSLTYLTTTRPNMMFVTSLISRYMAKPIELHLQAAKRALRYLKEIVNYGIHYKRGGDGKLLAFTDSNYARDMKDRKSTSGYVFLLSSSVVSWSSKKQPIVTLSTTEAEFVAAVVCACQANWMKKGIEGARAW